ncbi:MAG: cytochrome c biogenesis protein ResB, partial [Nitrospirota bacterium]
FEKLGFMDMYHSWWFVTLLILFSANIVICSVDRLPRIWKTVREPMHPITEEHLRKATIKKELILKGKPDRVKDIVTSAIKGVGFSYIESKEDKGYQFYSQKGSFTRLGVYITHLSILIILIGSLVGIFLGFKGFLPLPEGRSSSVALLNTGSLTRMEGYERERILNAIEASSGNISNASMQLSMDENSLMAKMRRYGIQPLGFSIRCDDFNVDFYGGSDMPKEFKSWLTVIDNGKEVLKKAIEVNNPLTYKGITFYQASYGLIPHSLERGIFIFKLISKDGKTSNLELRFGDTFEIPGTKISGKITNFHPALKITPGRQLFASNTNQLNSPAVYIDFSESGSLKPYSGWIFKRYPETWQLPEGHRVEFIDYWGTQYTGLQVRRDPGVWVVYLGCITISIGLYIAFFMSHRRIWVRIVEEKNNTRVVVGATSNKNRAAFERKINKLISLLSKKQEGGK